MRQRVRRALVPALLLAMVLAGCSSPERGVELVEMPRVPRPQVAVSSTVFPTPDGSASFIDQYQQWLEHGSSGAPNAPSGPLEILEGLR